MKRVKINKGSVALVFHRGEYRKVLTAGNYWLGFFEEIKNYNLAKPFIAPVELNLLLEDPALARLLTVVEVKDQDIVLLYENGNFKRVLTPGRYTFWKGLITYDFVRVDLNKVTITEKVDMAVLENIAVLAYLRIFVVQAHEKGLLFVDGKMERELETGVYHFWKNAIPLQVLKVDLRQQQMEISGQELLTKDKAALRINFYTQYKVVDIHKALLDVKDYEKQLYLLMQLALREFVGTLTLDELLDKKEAVGEYVLQALQTKAAALGVNLVHCGIRDIILPGEVKEIMNQVLVAQKKAQANIITRREETASTRSLLNTAKLMEENTMLFKLKEMEYVEKIADKINTISLSGGNQVVEQLKDIFSPGK